MKKTIAIIISVSMVLVSSISVFADENSKKTHPETTFTTNTNPDKGGAIYWNGNKPLIDAPFTNNSNPDNGGAIYWDGNKPLIDAPFTNNSNPDNGGAIYFA